MFFKLFRLIAGQLVLLINWLTFPAKGKRSSEQLQQLEQQLSNHALYQLPACPFCVKVRREIQRLNLPLEIRNIKDSDDNRNELLEGGGKAKVPCLRIDSADGSSQWMYESDDINAYLNKQFSLNL